MAKLTSYSKTLRSGVVATYHRVRFYNQEKGKPDTKDFPTKRDALAFLKKVDQGIADEPVVQQQQSMSVKEASDQFIAECRKGRDGRVPLEPTTIEDYLQKFARGEGRDWWTLPLDQVTKQHARDFRDYLLDERGLARSTTRNTLSMMRTLVQWAIDEDHYVGANPFKTVTVAKDARANEDGPVLKSEIHTRAEVTKIFVTLDELCASRNRNSVRAWLKYRAMVCAALLCGPRLSEIRGLPRDKVDLETNTLTIEWRADRNGVLGRLKSGNGYREIPIPPRAQQAFKAWFDYLDAEEAARSPAERKRRLLDAPDLPFEGELAFPELGGGVMDPQNFGRNGWRKLCKDNGLKYRRFHATRHFFASGLINAPKGIHLKDLAYMMGHSDEAFTLKRYGKLMHDVSDKDRRREAVESAAAALDV